MVSYRRGKITAKRLDVTAADTDPPFVSTALPSANLNALAHLRLIGLTSHEQKRLRSHPVTAEDMWAIRNRCVVTLLLASGLGIEELMGLTNQDVQLSAGYLEVRSEHPKARRVYVDVDLCRQDYESWLALHPLNTQPAFFVFITRRLTPLSVRLVYHIVSQYLTAAGIRKKNRLGANLLRQTAILNAVHKGATLEELRDNFGIQTYEHLKAYTTFKP